MAATARSWPAVSRRVSAGTRLCRTAVRPGISAARSALPAGGHGTADPDLPGSGDTSYALLLPSDRHCRDRLRDPGFVEAGRWRLHRRRSGFEAGTHVDDRQLAVGVVAIAIVVIAAAASSGGSS